MIGSCIYHNKNVALLDTHILSRVKVKVTPAPGYNRHPTDTARLRGRLLARGGHLGEAA